MKEKTRNNLIKALLKADAVFCEYCGMIATRSFKQPRDNDFHCPDCNKIAVMWITFVNYPKQWDSDIE